MDQTKENKMEGFGILLILFSFLVVVSFIAYLLFDVENCHKANEQLKSDLYEAKKEVKDLRDKNLQLRLNCTDR